MKSKLKQHQETLQQEILRIEKFWYSQLEQMESPNPLAVASCMEESAKEAAPFRKALAELKKIKS